MKRTFAAVPAVLGVLVLTAAAARADFVIGLNFAGTNLSQVPPLNGGFSLIPPDTMGAVGPSHFVEFTNGSFAVYDKGTGALVGSRISLNTFWNNITGLGLSSGGNFATDPHVLYDNVSGRWFAVAIDTLSSNNHALIAVSNSSNPTAGWTGFTKIEPNSRFNDFPMVGINQNALVVGYNDFTTSGSGDRVSMLVLPKSDLISGTVANATFLSNASPSIDPNTTGFSPHPVIDPSGSGSLSVLSSFNDTNLKLSTVTNTNTTTPGLNTTGGFMTTAPLTTPPSARQPGGPNTIDTGDSRFSGDVVKVNGQLWGVQTIDSGGRAALRWFRIDPSTQTILESGLISNPSRDYYYGSLAVNTNGDVVIGFTGSSDLTTTGFNGTPSAFAVVGHFDGILTTFSLPTLLKEGNGSYDVTLGGPSNRWGDYSSTTVDPNDPSIFWTIQEFVSGANNWSTQITQIRITTFAAPEPGSLTLVGLGAVSLICYGWRRRRGEKPAAESGD